MNGARMIPDPRVFPSAASATALDRALYALAEACLAAPTGHEADALRMDLRAALDRALRGDGDALAATLAGAPSVAVARVLWRTLDTAWRDATREGGPGLAVTVFAIPLVVVVGVEEAERADSIPAVLADPAALAAILTAHGCLAGNRSVALANVLVAADAIDVGRLPELLAWQRLPEGVASGPVHLARTLVPSPLACSAGAEGVHLRFLVGSAIAKPGLDLLTDETVDKWGMGMTRELERQLGGKGIPVLALPRAPLNPLRALQQGRAAQREVAAQVFASNAIRRLRERVGEPAAVLSAHRAPDAPGGGELRLSVSSPFEPREAEGFRCPLYALDRVDDVVAMFVDLLRDCRVADIRVLRGVYPDRAPGAGSPLLFKPDTMPRDDAGVVH